MKKTTSRLEKFRKLETFVYHGQPNKFLPRWSLVFAQFVHSNFFRAAKHQIFFRCSSHRVTIDTRHNIMHIAQYISKYENEFSHFWSSLSARLAENFSIRRKMHFSMRLFVDSPRFLIDIIMPKTGWRDRGKKRDPTVHKGVFISDYHIWPVIIRHWQGLFPRCIDFLAGKYKQK